MGDREITQTQDKIENALALAPVRPIVTPKQAAKDLAAFEDLKRATMIPQDYQIIRGQPHPKKSFCRKIALVCNISDIILEQVRTDREDGTFTWRITVKAEAPNGRVCTGVGVCDSRERGFAHVEHDTLATAHTRAKNRVILDMVAGGVVSAEEMDGSSSETTHSDAGTDTPVRDRNGIVDALESAGLDTEDLEISVKEGKTVVKPTKFLGDVWDRFNSALWKLGFSWVSAGKESHWISGE